MDADVVSFFKEHLSDRLRSLDEGQKVLNNAVGDLRVETAKTNGAVTTLNEKVIGVEKSQNAMLFKVVLPVMIGIILTAINVAISLKR